MGAALAWLNEPQHERAWRQGAEGERKTAQRLDKHLKGSGVLLLHDRLIPRSRANLDHLAVGPGGVTVIDAKHLHGQVRAERRGGLLSPRTEHLKVGGRDRTKLIDGLEHQLTVVRAILAELDEPGLTVAGCLCLVDADGLPLFGTVNVRGLPVVGARGAARLAARAGHLSAPVVDDLHARLTERLVPA